jgi:hypothetical protein
MVSFGMGSRFNSAGEKKRGRFKETRHSIANRDWQLLTLRRNTAHCCASLFLLWASLSRTQSNCHSLVSYKGSRGTMPRDAIIVATIAAFTMTRWQDLYLQQSKLMVVMVRVRFQFVFSEYSENIIDISIDIKNFLMLSKVYPQFLFLHVAKSAYYIMAMNTCSW